VQFNSFSLPADNNDMFWGLVGWNYASVGLQFSDPGTSSPLTVQDTFNSGVSWDGITNYGSSFTGNGGRVGVCYFLSSATVFLNSFYTQGYSDSTIIGVAAHEAGHAIGLAHTNGCVLMTPNTGTRINCGINTPQTDDINCARAIY
jgi:hypothetical protein